MENEVRDKMEINGNAEDAIMEMRLCAVSDVSMKNNQMGGCWKLVNFDNKMMKSRESHNKKWGANSPKASVAMEMLDMLTHMKNYASSSAEGHNNNQ